MKMKPPVWLIFLCLSIISFLVWHHFSYPQFASVNISISRAQALTIAKKYVKEERGIDISNFLSAIVFTNDDQADRYLQKNLRFKGEQEFLKRHDFDMFFWLVRFFQENKKEEFRLTISSATGEIIGFHHMIEDTAARPMVDQDHAKATAIEFLKTKFNFNPDEYTLKANLTTVYDYRNNHSFSWWKNGVYIPWSKEPETGGAKLVISISLAGDEILSFNKNQLDIPDGFTRFIEQQQNIGNNLVLLFQIAYIILLTSATYFVVIRRNHLIMHTTKNFCVILTGVLFVLSILANLNDFEHVLFQIPTTTSFNSYLWTYSLDLLIITFFSTISILMPSLSGESLHYEVFRQKKEGSLLFYITSTFFSRTTAQAVLLGYLIFIIMLGIQTIAFEIGYRHWGVWVEHAWMTQQSAAYFPFFTAFVIGFQASILEEITFRIFTISWLKKLLKSTFWACLLSSIIWGFGHCGYLVFPMWFRGIEVTCLGLFLSFIYLRFGIIPVIIAHFTFNVFWANAAYLLGRSHPYYFYSSLLVFLLPLTLGIIAFLLNKPQEQKPLTWKLNKHQLFNLEVLNQYIETNQLLGHKTKDEVRKDLIAHGWDIAVIETALKSDLIA